MATAPKSVRKTVTFDGSNSDQSLLDAIETELRQKQHGSFGELCKIALHQFLLSREPTQSVILFMELERQIAELQSRVAQIEASGSGPPIERLEDAATVKADKPPADPLLARLSPLLEDF